MNQDPRSFFLIDDGVGFVGTSNMDPYMNPDMSDPNRPEVDVKIPLIVPRSVVSEGRRE